MERLTKEQVAWVIDINTLENQAHLCLEERVQIIRERFDIPYMTPQALSGYYRRYGVKFQRPNYVFWKGSAELKDLKTKQFEFVEKLGTIMRDEAYDEIIYLDETTFNLWQKTSKCWLRPGMKLRMPCNRGPSITVIGTISIKKGLIHLEVFQGTNNATIFH
jgi:hypothetical protein